MRVAVVDDDPLTAKALSRAVRMMGHAVAAFTDPHLAAATIILDPPDVVIADYAMPAMSGVQLRRLVKRSLGDDTPPFILVSGTLSEIDADAQNEFAAYLRKPFELSELREVILGVG